MKVEKGQIVYLKTENKNGKGHIQMGRRPFLVVSNDIGNRFSEFAMVVPLTTKLKKLSQPTHVVIDYNNSMVICEQIFTIRQSDIVKIECKISEFQMKFVDECLKMPWVLCDERSLKRFGKDMFRMR